MVSCEMRLISFTPSAARAAASATMDSIGRLRCFPRMSGMAQNVQCRLQPSAILTYAECALPSRSLGVSSRSEEHTSELQSRLHLVCRLLLEKKKNKNTYNSRSHN